MVLVGVVLAGVLVLGIGAVLGRYYVPDQRPLQHAARQGLAYARGLVCVLEGRSEAAIKELTAALRRDTNTVEAYFALGALFRERREYERAVRVHQTLLVRRDLDKQTRLHVHIQLGQDFNAAGFRRRAIKAFEWVLAHDSKNLDVLRELAALYQAVGAWAKAAAVHRRLERVAGGDTAEMVAHLLAQLASEAMDQGRMKEARQALRQASSASAHSVHVLYVMGEYQQRNANPSGAERAWRTALERAPELVVLLFPKLCVILAEQNKIDQADSLLAELAQRHPENVHLRLLRARHLMGTDRTGALQLLRTILDDHPNLLPARRDVARLALQSGDSEAVRRALRELLDVRDATEVGYRCISCGSVTPGHAWRCASCQQWGTVVVAWGRRGTERIT